MKINAPITTKPFVSIVVPIYNEGRRIEECLKALLNLDYPPDRYEIIAVNNGSTDNTGEIIDSYPVIRIDEQRRGSYYAHNAGVQTAKGEVIAFTGADCAPERQWLKELLKEIKSEDIGCFVGEIAPQSFVSLVDEYVHDRRIINQKQLLSSNPPVVATGNVAYRKAVFDTIGLFDESFKSGGDVEFSWRMQKCSNFRIRYNPKAIIFHPHPSNLKHLLRRSYFIGIGIAQLRLKHAGDFPEKMISIIHYRRIIFITALGIIKYPFRVAVNLKKGMSFRKSLIYPVLGKLCALTHEAGILNGLKRKKALKKHISVAEQKGLSDIFLFRGGRDVVGGYFDQTFLDLDKASFFLKDEPELTALVRAELKTISQCLLKIIPEATILLTGSFSAGEGRDAWSKGQKVIQSDYDIVVVTPSFASTIPYVVSRRLAALEETICFSTDIEIALLWKPLLERRLTTTAGKIIAGRRDLCKILEGLPSPRTANTIAMAHRFLAEAPLNPLEHSTLLSKALMRAAQATLLHRYKKSPREEWVQLSSIRFCRDKIGECSGIISKRGVNAIQRAAHELLGERNAGWGKEDLALAKEVLQTIQSVAFPFSPCWQDFLRHAFWLHQKRILGLPNFRTTAYCIQGLRLLVEVWRDGDQLEKELLTKVYPIAYHLCYHKDKVIDEDPQKTYARLFNLFSNYLDFYPNKLYYPNTNFSAKSD